MKFQFKFTNSLSLLRVLALVFFITFATGCSSSQKNKEVALPDLSATATDTTPTPETAPAAETATPERAPASEPEPVQEQPSGPVCVSRWEDLAQLAPIPGISNIQRTVSSGTAAFRATGDGKMFKLRNSNGQISIETPDQGSHHINKVCKEGNGHLTAQAVGPFGMHVDINIRSTGGRGYNIQFLNNNVDAEVVE